MERMAIAVAVVLHDGRVLVGRRSHAAADAAGRDEFPGGKVEVGEAPAAAAVRECREETGLEIVIDDLRPLDTVAAAATPGPIDVIFFRARLRGPAAGPRPPFSWVAVGDLPARRFPAANAGVLAWLHTHHGGS